MRVHTITIIVRLIVLVAGGVLGVFIFGVDPDSLTLAGRTLFFLSLWVFTVMGTLLVLLALARRFLAKGAVHDYLPGAFRQGALVGSYITSMALAQFLGYLVWWVAFLSLVFMLLIEITVRQIIDHP